MGRGRRRSPTGANAGARWERGPASPHPLLGRLESNDGRRFLVRLAAADGERPERLELDEQDQDWVLLAEPSAILDQPQPWQRNALRVQREDGLVFAVFIAEEDRARLAQSYRSLKDLRRGQLSPLGA